MQFDFTNPPGRLGTDSQKWQKYEGRDILPMWVADMDFKSPPALLEALHRRVDHGIFGYARPARSTINAVVDALAVRYGWAIDPKWLVWLPGLVVGLNVTAQAFAEPGEEVLTLTPIYPPFLSAPRHSRRVPVGVPCRLNASGSAGRWEIDWDALEKAVTPRTRMFLLCNPHNPLGRVWRREELERLGDFCIRHNLVLCADEIHCDLILDPALSHTVAATLSPALAARTLTLMAPSKTYNVPGLGTSFAVIPDDTLRTKFNRAAAGIVAEVTTLGFAACESAYRDCEPWRQELLAVLRGNRDRLVQALGTELPGMKLEAPLEATYLAWLNVTALKLEDPIAHFEKFGVGLSECVPFGAARGSYVRINLGCTRATLDEAIRRMKSALAAL
jgi:cystathionine beta-lyase